MKHLLNLILGMNCLRRWTDNKVSCQVCGKELGYVVRNGHKEWACEAHSGVGKVEALNA